MKNQSLQFSKEKVGGAGQAVNVFLFSFFLPLFFFLTDHLYSIVKVVGHILYVARVIKGHVKNKQQQKSLQENCVFWNGRNERTKKGREGRGTAS